MSIMAENTIFIALASYCEPELDLTVQDAIDKARHPENLRFGICHQYDPDGEPAIHEDCIDHRLGDSRFRILKYHFKESQGGCWARHLVQTMYADEQYTLQVDAHSRFVDGWDEKLIAMMDDFPSDKPLITGFPPLYFRENGVDIFPPRDDMAYTNVTVCKTWSPEGWIHHPTIDVPESKGRARRTRFLSGAFVFTAGDWNREVMQDPGHYYTGEEFALALRSFTSGYDLFVPDEIVVWHRCHPEPNRKHFSDNPGQTSNTHHTRAIERLRALMHGDSEHMLGRFGLGNERSLHDFYIFSGLNCQTYDAHPDAISGVPPDPVTLGR